MTSTTERRLPRLFLLILAGVLALAGWQWHDRSPLSANLMELVPGTDNDALVTSAEKRMQAPLNREMLVLVGHADRQQAVELARTLPNNGKPAVCSRRSSGRCKPICPRCAPSCCKAESPCCQPWTARC